jgi:hypothetical protein
MGTIPAEYSRDKTMNAITTQNGTRIYYKEKLFGKSQALANRLTMIRVIAV